MWLRVESAWAKVYVQYWLPRVPVCGIVVYLHDYGSYSGEIAHVLPQVSANPEKRWLERAGSELHPSPVLTLADTHPSFCLTGWRSSAMTFAATADRVESTG